MSVEPVLSEREWVTLGLLLVGKMPGGPVRGRVVMDLPVEHQRAAIAVANACLEDTDPLKITWGDVDMLYRAASDRDIGGGGCCAEDCCSDHAVEYEPYESDELRELATKLSALLRPR